MSTDKSESSSPTARVEPSPGKTTQNLQIPPTPARRIRHYSWKPRDVLGLKVPITDGLIRAGLSTSVIKQLSQRLDLSTEKTLGYVSINRQTYARRRKAGKLSSNESDRVWRVARLVANAYQLLGDDDSAAEWLHTPSPALNGDTPLERAKTEIGAWDVQQLIGRLEHGIPT